MMSNAQTRSQDGDAADLGDGTSLAVVDLSLGRLHGHCLEG